MGDDGRVSLLDEIQATAVDSTHPLSDLLRKCQVLAARLRHQPFKEWVSHELNGYPDETPLPRYRGPFQGEVKADLLGFMGASAKNVGVPLTNIPEEIREEFRSLNFYQGVGMLESLIADANRTGETALKSMYSSELAAMTPVWQNYQAIAMWVEVPVASVAGILDQVRSRALEFVLEIETENPEAGTTATSEPPVPLARADTIFNTTIYGGNVAVGTNATVNVMPGDLGSLLAYLEAQGVAADDRAELEAALAEDQNKLGPRVKAWLGGVVAKTASFGSGTAQNAVGSLIAFAVLRFLNLA